MALQNPSNLYSGGSAVLNSAPYIQFYLQNQAKKRAKDEALDAYFRDFNKSINPAGMRNQDIEGFNMKVNDWRNFYNQNKESIQNPKKDNGRSYTEFMSRYQDLMGDTQKSKSEAELKKQYLLPILSNPDKRTRVTDLTMNKIAKSDLPIYHPDYQPFNPSDTNFEAKRFGIAERQKVQKALTDNLEFETTVSKITVDPKSKKSIVVYEKQMNPEALMVSAERAASIYNSDESYHNFINSEIDRIGVTPEMNNTFRALTGRDISSESDFAAAYEVSQIQKKYQEQKVASYSTGRSGGGGSGKVSPAEQWVNDMYNATASGNPQSIENVASQLFSGLGRDEFEGNVYLLTAEQTGDRPALQINYKGKVKNKKGEDIIGQNYERIYLDDPNIKTKLAGLYQRIMGATSKVEEASFYKNQQPIQPKQNTKPKTTNRPPLDSFITNK